MFVPFFLEDVVVGEVVGVEFHSALSPIFSLLCAGSPSPYCSCEVRPTLVSITIAAVLVDPRIAW